MTSIRRTASPRFNSPLSDQELEELYQPTEEELHFVRRNAKGDAPRLTLLLLLKCQQHLGYTPALELIPENIRDYLCRHLEVSTATALTDGAEKTLYRYRQLMRAYLAIKSYSQGGVAVVEAATRQAAYTMSDPADLINVAAEQLIRQRNQLPAFSTPDRQVNHIRQQVHEALYQQVAAHLNAAQRQRLDALLEVQPGRTRTDLNRLKEPPGPATLQHLRRWEERLAWLAALPDAQLCLKGMANTKIKQFTGQAQALEVGDLRDIQAAPQRYTLLLCLVYEAQVRTWDQLGTMFLKRMRRIHHQDHDQLRVLQDRYRDLTEQMVTALAEIAHHATETVADAAFGQQVRQVLAAHGGPEANRNPYSPTKYF